MINLSSPQEKKNILIIHRWQQMWVGGVLVFGLVVVSASLVSSSYLVVKTEEKTISAEKKEVATVAQSRLSVEEQQRIKKIIEQIKKDEAFIKGSQTSQLVESLINSLPQGISLSEVSLRQVEGKNDWKVSVKGKSVSRDNFVDWVKRLKGISGVSQLESPVANLIKSVDTEFSLTWQQAQK